MPFTGQGTGIQNANDIFFSGLAANHVLRYNNATSKWNNVPLSVANADIPDNTITEAKLSIANVPTTNHLLSWDGSSLSWTALTKSSVGLANVDNTSDANKPVSTATQTALNGKADGTRTITGANSITGGGDLTANRTLSLVNDTASPGNDKYYGTNGAGTKGFHTLPAGGSGSLASATDADIVSPLNGQRLSYNSTSAKWENIPAGIPLATVSLPGVLSTGTISLPFPIFGTWVFEALVVNVGTPSAGAAIVTDLLYNGTTIFGTPANRPSVAAGSSWDASGTPSVTQYLGSGSTRGYLQFTIVSVGSSGTEGADLVATLYASRIA